MHARRYIFFVDCSSVESMSSSKEPDIPRVFAEWGTDQVLQWLGTLQLSRDYTKQFRGIQLSLFATDLSPDGYMYLITIICINVTTAKSGKNIYSLPLSTDHNIDGPALLRLNPNSLSEYSMNLQALVLLVLSVLTCH